MRRLFRQFAEEEVAPRSAELDRTGEFPRDIWRRMGELGILGLRLDPRYGGQGLDCVTTGIAAEEIARGDFSCSYGVLLPNLNGDILQNHADEAVKEEWLRPLITGDAIIALGLTEPGSGSDAAAMKTRAVRQGDEYVIRGEKSGISLTAVADAVILFAKTDPEQRARGVSAFLVPLDRPGVSRSVFEDMGERPIKRGSLFFDDVRIPARYRIGEEGRGFYQVMNGFDYSRCLIGLQCLGAAQAGLEETIAYVKQRYAFGQPLARFEGVSFPIAEHYTMIEVARWLCYRGLWLRDQGLPHTKEAAMAKWLGPKVAFEALHDCLLLHGHYGYTKEVSIERRFRDVIGLEIGDGTAQIQKIIIARELMGREYLPY